MRRISAALLLLCCILLLCACGRSDPMERAAKQAERSKPIDFSDLDGAAAWLYLPGTGVNAPVYADEAGGFFLQTTYNSPDFSDPVTVIYHTADTRLESLYSQNGSLEKYPEIRLLLPDGSTTWRVIGFSAFDSMHILDTYQGFAVKSNVGRFLNSVKDYHTMIHDFLPDIQTPERLLIISTHLRSDPQQRFLVLSVPEETAG